MSKLIDRQSALDAIKYAELGREYDEVEKVQIFNPWHRVEEEIPEYAKVVIIHKEFDGEITLGYCYGFGENKLWMCLKTPYNTYEVPWVGAGLVDYWMPLPEPPMEGTHENRDYP